MASRRTGLAVGGLVLALALLAVAVFAVFGWLRARNLTAPIPGQQRCVATASGRSVTVDLDQAHYASIIVGISVRRGLAPRAASIALATAYQESGIRNLDYGDRDSIGLFQQRPSSGWGTKKQILDPYYATGKFYDALVKVKDWRTGDINDVAQKVQRSGYPEAYRDHEPDARVLASALTGNSPGGFTCLERAGEPGDAKAAVDSLTKTFRTVEADRDGSSVTVRARSAKLAWAYAHYAVANSRTFGLTQVQVDDQVWRTGSVNLPAWIDADDTQPDHIVRLIVR